MPTRSSHVPRWVAVAVPLILFGGVLFCVVLYWPWIMRPRVQWRSALPQTLEGGRCAFERTVFEGRFIGHSETEIVARFGRPSERLRGEDAGPFEFDRREYPEAHTVRYAAVGGQLYLAYCRQRGKWVCFRALWLADAPLD
jgi:hypothetical protein